MNLNGGYAMIKHDATQKELEVAYKTKRPVLLYDADHRAHWAQINEKVIETVDEETQETITTYEYSYQLLNAIEALVDASGNPRFIEGDGTPATITGFISTYCKWSLSGTHLMLVLAGSFANGTVISGDIATFNLPDYIKDKIFAFVGNFIEFKSIVARAESLGTQNIEFQNILTSTGVKFATSNVTLTADRYFRVQFDLLIDNE